MPLPLLYALLVGLGFGAFLKLLLTGNTEIVNIQSNCHDEFLKFNENLYVTKSKLKKLKTARKAIQNKIKEHFRELNDYTVPKFYIQGSSQIGTLIRNKKDLCDFDIGIYFFSEPRHTFETLQKHIKQTLTGHTLGKISLLDKCVRIKYSGDFHLDMPIYYTKNKVDFYLGSKGNNWQLCDSKIFKEWVSEQTKDTPQIIRLIRYFKAWSDNYYHKLPSGLAFTIWSIKHYECDNRDDVAFIQTAASILKNLKDNYWSSSSWECTMPVEPKDNVIDNLDRDQKTNFKLALEELIKEGVEALSSEDKNKALKKWNKIFGRRFDF
jgi:hypothetical protein